MNIHKMNYNLLLIVLQFTFKKLNLIKINKIIIKNLIKKKKNMIYLNGHHFINNIMNKININ